MKPRTVSQIDAFKSDQNPLAAKSYKSTEVAQGIADAHSAAASKIAGDIARRNLYPAVENMLEDSTRGQFREWGQREADAFNFAHSSEAAYNGLLGAGPKPNLFQKFARSVNPVGSKYRAGVNLYKAAQAPIFNETLGDLNKTFSRLGRTEGPALEAPPEFTLRDEVFRKRPDPLGLGGMTPLPSTFLDALSGKGAPARASLQWRARELAKAEGKADLAQANRRFLPPGRPYGENWRWYDKSTPTEGETILAQPGSGPGESTITPTRLRNLADLGREYQPPEAPYVWSKGEPRPMVPKLNESARNPAMEIIPSTEIQRMMRGRAAEGNAPEGMPVIPDWQRKWDVAQLPMISDRGGGFLQQKRSIKLSDLPDVVRRLLREGR